MHNFQGKKKKEEEEEVNDIEIFISGFQYTTVQRKELGEIQVEQAIKLPGW